MLRNQDLDDGQVEALLEALTTVPGQAPVSAADRMMLDYALKLTHAPGAVDGDDVEELRHHGFDDRAIHDVCAIVAYFAFVNRIADGLGVELEAGP